MGFPSVTGNNLEGRPYRLPRDFESPYNVVLLVFTQEQQYDVDTWQPYLATLKAQVPMISTYELPTITRGTWFWRRMIDYWMVTGIPDPKVRAATITLYLDVGAFVGALKLPNTEAIYTLLLDRNGTIYWQAAGRFRPELGQHLTDTVQSLPQSLTQFMLSPNGGTHV
jgi:hypothetical protein